MTKRLTDQIVRRASAGNRPQVFFWDDQVKGFALRVTTRGAKAFVLDYRVNGRQRRITIGSYPDWSVAAAREKAKAMKREVDLGADPMGERHDERTAPTVKDLWSRYSSEHLALKSPRSQADETAMWRDLILPQLSKEHVRDISTDHVERLHRRISVERGTPVRANRVIEVFRKALNLAIRWQWRSDNPATGIRKNPEHKRERYLSLDEIARLNKALADHPEQTSTDAIRLLMLTGARRGEVLNATWDMFDLDAGVWTMPSAHTKQRRLHRVPLADAAVELLRRIKRSNESVYVFPGKSSDNPLTDIKRTWQSVCNKAGIQNARIHDLRHSFASILVSHGASLPLIGAMLGHTQVQTTQRYAHLYDEPLKGAAELVSQAINGASYGPNIGD
ncbi:tyrosine-type recombinase/integrase [Thalassobaculum litoreum]|uniref:Site-specific recombinase XerD n=1 Tax=Thalassobaculum litoreum DSM 18839 TaxID=1123362 RepID=A0A8G2BM89_9PROT|nr:site-specific integrase [Thalassobaculum litoreum]SDG17385.1 Site-specific recombinase XerD [Thalassobaculum litoreum DSM 18839]